MSREKQIEEMAECCPYFWNGECTVDAANPTNCDLMCEMFGFMTSLVNAGYRKQSENVIELPCKAGDLVHFKGLETPWKVSAIHIYEEGQPQISITSETGKITSTMTANEFYMFCAVLTDVKMKGGGEG